MGCQRLGRRESNARQLKRHLSLGKHQFNLLLHFCAITNFKTTDADAPNPYFYGQVYYEVRTKWRILWRMYFFAFFFLYQIAIFLPSETMYVIRLVSFPRTSINPLSALDMPSILATLAWRKEQWRKPRCWKVCLDIQTGYITYPTYNVFFLL